LTAFDQLPSLAGQSEIGIPPSAFRNLIEPLTERELEILRLLPSERSTRELAEHLVVSINTIKTQLKSIYDKLDVHSREEALDKARQLKMI
jgi:LuxR family maltose regulon positive regulatory protein